MPEPGEQLGDYDPGAPEHSWRTSLAIITVGTAAFIGAYIGAGYEAASTYSPEQAAKLVEADGFKNPHFIKREVGFVSLHGSCHAFDEVKYEFEVDNPNGSHVRVDVCRGLGKTSYVDEPTIKLIP